MSLYLAGEDVETMGDKETPMYLHMMCELMYTQQAAIGIDHVHTTMGGATHISHANQCICINGMAQPTPLAIPLNSPS